MKRMKKMKMSAEKRKFMEEIKNVPVLSRKTTPRERERIDAIIKADK